MKVDPLRTLNQKKSTKGKRCFGDSDKLVKSTQEQTITEIKEEIRGKNDFACRDYDVRT